MVEKRLEDFSELQDGNLVRVTFKTFDAKATYEPGLGYVRREHHYPVVGYVKMLYIMPAFTLSSSPEGTPYRLIDTDDLNNRIVSIEALVCKE